MIFERKSEDRKVHLSYEEAKVQAITMAVHAAAGNEKGVNAAAQFSFTAGGPARSTPAPRTNEPSKVGQLFGGAPAFSREQILAARKAV